jgi:hypothetical protein
MRSLNQIRRAVFVCAFTSLTALPGWCAVVGAVRGVVHDPMHLPVPHASIMLQSSTSEFKLAAETGTDGAFLFDALPVGEYVITVQRQGFLTEQAPVTVDSYSTPTLHFQLRLAQSSEKLQVFATGDIVNASSMTPATTIDRYDLDQTPGADRTNSLAMITDYVPGAYLAHDQLHIRGGHQVDWLVDGQETTP